MRRLNLNICEKELRNLDLEGQSAKQAETKVQ